MRSCARRSFDDATIFMAFVICCVDLVARTRRRMSISDGILSAASGWGLAAGSSRPRSGGRECLRELLERGVQLRLEFVVEGLLGLDRAEQRCRSASS